MEIFKRKDFWAGLLVFIIGSIWFWGEGVQEITGQFGSETARYAKLFYVGGVAILAALVAARRILESSGGKKGILIFVAVLTALSLYWFIEALTRYAF